MADSENSYVKTYLSRDLHSSAELNGKKSAAQVKSFTHFLGKFLIFALFLIAIPLFPSQAPDFINQTIFTNFWELVHLLFIGLAVSYGLFCRRNDDMEIETQSNETDDSMSYVSAAFHVSSIFEDGFYNSYGYNEKNVYQTWYSENGSFSAGDQSKVRSLNSEDKFGNPSGYGENNLSQTWNYSQYVQGESAAVTNKESCVVDEYGEARLMMGHKPLGLPVRSLRSRAGTQDVYEISDVTTVSSSISTDSSNSPKESVGNSFGEMGPLSSETKLNDSGNVAVLSPVPFHSVSGGKETRENLGIASHPLHFRPLSDDESQIESLKTQTFGSIGNLFSQTNSVSSSRNSLSPDPDVSLKLENWKMEGLGTEQIYRKSYPPATTPTNGKTSMNAFHIRRYTNDSLFEKNVHKSFVDDFKIRGESKIKDQQGNKERRSSSLKWTGRMAKASSTGKSVRTFRSRKYEGEAVKAGEKYGGDFRNDVGKPSQEIDALCKLESEMTNGGLDNLPTTAGKQDVDCHPPVPKQKHSEFQKRKNKKHSENVVLESKETSENQQAENFEVKSVEEFVTDPGNDTDADPNEVDKKAGEFIARFREQIRLQKMASISSSRGHNHLHLR